MIIVLLLFGLFLFFYYSPPQISVTDNEFQEQDNIDLTPFPELKEWEKDVAIWENYNPPLYFKMKQNLARLLQLYQEIVIDNNQVDNCKYQYQIAKKYRSLVLNQFHNLIYQTENHPYVIQKFNISLYQLQQLTHAIVHSIVEQCHAKIKKEGYHIDNLPITNWNVPEEFNKYSHPASNGMYDNHLLF